MSPAFSGDWGGEAIWEENVLKRCEGGYEDRLLDIWDMHKMCWRLVTESAESVRGLYGPEINVRRSTGCRAREAARSSRKTAGIYW